MRKIYFILISMLIICVRVGVAEEKILFSDGFEQGDSWDIGKPSEVEAEQTLVTSPVHSGKYVLRNHLISEGICSFSKGMEPPLKVKKGTI